MFVSTSLNESFETVSLMIDESGVAHLALNRPEVHNAFNEAMIDELTHCFRLLSSSDTVRLVVLSSNGSVFCAGADLAWMKRASANDPDGNQLDATRFADMMHAIYGCKKPVIARVVGVHRILTHRGCGHFLGLGYVVNPKLSRYSMGLR
ncbi:hypothetical protein G3N97_20455 [Paraburkholderia sp. Ac-20347]|nr:hypothetical protein [Paraburkholderia sp. Ac-20347]